MTTLPRKLLTLKRKIWYCVWVPQLRTVKQQLAQYLKELPEDPLAAHEGFRLECQPRPIARMDIQTGEAVETNEAVVAIRSSTGRAEAYYTTGK